MALGDFKLFKENASGSFDERTVAAAPDKVFSWDINHDPVAVDVVPYTGAKYDLNLNNKALINVRSLAIGTESPLDFFHAHNGANTAHAYFSSTRETAGAAASFNLMNIHTGSYTRFVHRLYGNPLREQFILTVYDANISAFNQLLMFDLLDKSFTIGRDAANIFLMPSNNVGINTDNPQKTLHVNGDIEASDYYHDNFQGITQRVNIVDVAGTHILTFSGGLLVDYELI